MAAPLSCATPVALSTAVPPSRWSRRGRTLGFSGDKGVDEPAKLAWAGASSGNVVRDAVCPTTIAPPELSSVMADRYRR